VTLSDCLHDFVHLSQALFTFFHHHLSHLSVVLNTFSGV
jgi:hypothetical protein